MISGLAEFKERMFFRPILLWWTASQNFRLSPTIHIRLYVRCMCLTILAWRRAHVHRTYFEPHTHTKVSECQWGGLSTVARKKGAWAESCPKCLDNVNRQPSTVNRVYAAQENSSLHSVDNVCTEQQDDTNKTGICLVCVCTREHSMHVRCTQMHSSVHILVWHKLQCCVRRDAICIAWRLCSTFPRKSLTQHWVAAGTERTYHRISHSLARGRWYLRKKSIYFVCHSRFDICMENWIGRMKFGIERGREGENEGERERGKKCVSTPHLCIPWVYMKI